MGREIRRVPRNWQHPKNDRGHYQPLYDKDYPTAVKEWKQGFVAWENDTHPNRYKHSGEKWDMEYWEYEGNPPDPEMYREPFAEEPTCYQIYETVSEGTPVSPVFETKIALAEWLVSQGYSASAAERFAKEGWAPSMGIVVGRAFAADIETLSDEFMAQMKE